MLGFGMLGVVGIQTTLRANGDQAKQRSEAVRIAQEALEEWRAYSVLGATAGHSRTFDDITSAAAATVTGYTTNELAGGLVSPAGVSASRNLFGRHPGVPPQARDFGNGRSGFVPPQPGGGTVGWRFDNVTGLFVICATSVADNSLLTAEGQFSSCGAQNHLLVTGFLRFSTRNVQPSASDVTDANATGDGAGNYPARPAMELVQSAPTDLQGTRACFVSARNGLSYRTYYCGAAVQIASPTWGGRVELRDRSSFELAEDAGDDDDDRF
ncbi:MAG: hypothetical protein MUF53_12215, partial [Gemmatimonadaceae bacterium]|nr:hypothetical protein [Gemmatimonadaceae bacterium]